MFLLCRYCVLISFLFLFFFFVLPFPYPFVFVKFLPMLGSSIDSMCTYTELRKTCPQEKRFGFSSPHTRPQHCVSFSVLFCFVFSHHTLQKKFYFSFFPITFKIRESARDVGMNRGLQKSTGKRCFHRTAQLLSEQLFPFLSPPP